MYGARGYRPIIKFRARTLSSKYRYFKRKDGLWNLGKLKLPAKGKVNLLLISWFFISLELGGGVFTAEQISALKSKEDRGRIRFMIYDNIFWNFYYNFPKVRISLILWIIASSGFLGLHVYFFIYYRNFYAMSF